MNSRMPAGFNALMRTAQDYCLKTTPQEHALNRELYWTRGTCSFLLRCPVVTNAQTLKEKCLVDVHSTLVWPDKSMY
jgi:hypothetical protein